MGLLRTFNRFYWCLYFQLSLSQFFGGEGIFSESAGSAIPLPVRATSSRKPTLVCDDRVEVLAS